MKGGSFMANKDPLVTCRHDEYSSMEELLTNYPQSLKYCLDDTDEAFEDNEEDDIFYLLTSNNSKRRYRKKSFMTNKPHHSSKERRYVLSKRANARAKIHSCHGKGAEHKKEEQLLNIKVPYRRTGRIKNFPDFVDRDEFYYLRRLRVYERTVGTNVSL